jgi:pyruvate/2-oxoglutarate dehydrogenase complex dihydrolipoamide acyltransferase (E2) component
VDLSQVRGTGSGGRITVKDVQSTAKNGNASAS